MPTNIQKHANDAEGVQYATKSFLSGRCGGQTCGRIPRHKRSRRSGEGKSRPDTLPTHRGSRSKVICCGRPYWRKKTITASNAVCSWKSSRAWAERAIEVPASTKLQTSTTCWRLPCGLWSGETEPTSLKSIWISSNGSRRSLGWGGSLERGTRQPVVCRIFQIVRLERGRGTCAACNSGSRGR